jgi:hypothetical protein
MNELLVRQLDEVRRNVNSLTRKVKAAGKAGGKGAAQLSAALAQATLSLTKAQALDLYDPDTEEEAAA